jgi:hypothetical protein
MQTKDEILLSQYSCLAKREIVCAHNPNKNNKNQSVLTSTVSGGNLSFVNNNILLVAG